MLHSEVDFAWRQRFQKNIITKNIKKVLLLTNYRSDEQQSMLRFGKNLINSYRSLDFNFSEIFPRPYLTKIIPKGILLKWAAYIDKYILFPKQLKRKIDRQNPIDLIHVIDHSNSIYLPKIKKISSAKLLVTCHDLIAVRTALGEFPDAPRILSNGRRLQSWIRSSLNYADYFSCDSNQTKRDLNRLIPKSTSCAGVIHLGTEMQQSTNGKSPKININLSFDPGKTDFILHVGSSAWYKNRKSVLDSFINARNKNLSTNLKLVLVGPELQEHEIDRATFKWIHEYKNSIINISSLPEESLQVLYLHAKALAFPSHIEGFGWPPMEAAVHGCPVITTKTGAIYDLLRDYPSYVESNDQDSINRALLDSLQSNSVKKPRVTLPSNCECSEKYDNLYRQMLSSRE